MIAPASRSLDRVITGAVAALVSGVPALEGSPFRRVLIGDRPLIVDVTEFTAITRHFSNVLYEPATIEYLRRHRTRAMSLPTSAQLCASCLLPAAFESFGPLTNIVFERRPA